MREFLFVFGLVVLAAALRYCRHFAARKLGAFTFLYIFIPNTRVRFRDVWPGAIMAGLLWRLALSGFGWYVRDLSRFSIHGTIASVVVFLLWVYVSAIILLYGVEMTVAYARIRRLLRHDHAPRPGTATA